jgi:hypothetical protein
VIEGGRADDQKPGCGSDEVDIFRLFLSSFRSLSEEKDVAETKKAAGKAA